MAYATSAWLLVSLQTYFVKIIIYSNSILKYMLTGSTHVDQITATSAYADMAYARYILLTVAYMPRQQCKMLTRLIRILYL